MRFAIGDLVYSKSADYTMIPVNRPGLVTDILEDELGTCFYEVDFIDDRGWFEGYQLTQKGKK